MTNVKWTELRRLQPVTEWLHTRNISDRKYLLRALRSKTADKLGLGRRIAQFAEENENSQAVGNLLDELFGSYGVDRPDVAIFVKDAIHRMEKGHQSGDNVLVKPSERPPQIMRPQMPEGRPSSLQQLNQTVGVPNQPLNGNSKVQPSPPSQQKINEDEPDEPENHEEAHPKLNPFTNVDPLNPDMNHFRFAIQPEDPSQHENIQMLARDATPAEVVPSEKQIVQNDVMFDMFSFVPEGFGNGVNNKLYRMDVNHTNKIRYQEPLYAPRAYEGPELGIAPLPYQWKNQMDDSTIETYTMQLAREALAQLQTKNSTGATSSLYGNDVHRSLSSKGLPAPQASIFQKQIDNVTKMYPVKFQIKRKLQDTLTSLYDPKIDPTQLANQKPLARNNLNSRLALQTIHGNDWML